MANRDKRRSFTPEQKLFIIIEQGGTCPKCCKKLRNADVQFHHKKFWGRGGRTHVDNAEAICADCHSSLHHHERLGRAPRASVAASAAHNDDDDDDDDDDSAREFITGTRVTQLFADGNCYDGTVTATDATGSQPYVVTFDDGDVQSYTLKQLRAEVVVIHDDDGDDDDDYYTGDDDDDDDDDEDDGDSDNDVMMQDNDEDDEDDELWVPKKAKAKAKATTKKMPKKMPKVTELCEYEQERERNIACNQARMQQLLGGLPLKAPPPALAAKQHEKQNPSSKKKLPLKMSTTKVTKKTRTLLPFKHEGSPISSKAKALLDAGWTFQSNSKNSESASHAVRWTDPNGAPIAHTHRAYEKMKKMTMVTTKVKKKKPFTSAGKTLLNAGWECQFFKKNQRWTYGTTVVWGTGKALAAYEEMMAK